MIRSLKIQFQQYMSQIKKIMILIVNIMVIFNNLQTEMVIVNQNRLIIYSLSKINKTDISNENFIIYYF